MRKAIIILSGGMDSATLLYRLLKEEFQIEAVSFDYGQRHKKELQYAARLCEKLQIAHRIIDISNLNCLLQGSSLTSDIATPHGHYQAENMKLTVVPNRNMIMIAIAVGYAISQKANYIALGVHAGDHHIYPDCRPEFIVALNKAIQLGNYDTVQIYAPYINMSKGDIAKEGLKLGMNYDDTWTCYEGGLTPCYKCGACMERKEALKYANKD